MSINSKLYQLRILGFLRRLRWGWRRIGPDGFSGWPIRPYREARKDTLLKPRTVYIVFMTKLNTTIPCWNIPQWLCYYGKQRHSSPIVDLLMHNLWLAVRCQNIVNRMIYVENRSSFSIVREDKWDARPGKRSRYFVYLLVAHGIISNNVHDKMWTASRKGTFKIYADNRKCILLWIYGGWFRRGFDSPGHHIGDVYIGKVLNWEFRNHNIFAYVTSDELFE